MAAEASACSGCKLDLLADHGGIGGPVVGERLLLRDEDDGAARADVRGRDGDGAEDAGVEVLLDAREGDRVGDELLDGRRIDEADAVRGGGLDGRRAADDASA